MCYNTDLNGCETQQGVPADKVPHVLVSTNDDGQERSQIVGKQAPPRPGVPMAAAAVVMCQATAHTIERTLGRLRSN